MVGVIAGLVPCPLTLFAMFLALSRGVPEAGLTFAVSHDAWCWSDALREYATLTVLAREWMVASQLAGMAAQSERASRFLEGRNRSGACL